MKIKRIVFVIAAVGLVFFFLDRAGEKKTFREYDKRANIHFQNGQLNDAIAGWEAALRHFPGDVSIINKIGIAYVEQGMYNEAEGFYKKGLIIEPHNVEIHYNLALLYFRKSEYDRSLVELDKVIRGDYFYPNAHYLRGLIYEGKGFKDKAQSEYVEEVNANPGSIPGWGKLLSGGEKSK